MLFTENCLIRLISVWVLHITPKINTVIISVLQMEKFLGDDTKCPEHSTSKWNIRTQILSSLTHSPSFSHCNPGAHHVQGTMLVTAGETKMNEACPQRTTSAFSPLRCGQILPPLTPCQDSPTSHFSSMGEFRNTIYSTFSITEEMLQQF